MADGVIGFKGYLTFPKLKESRAVGLHLGSFNTLGYIVNVSSGRTVGLLPNYIFID